MPAFRFNGCAPGLCDPEIVTTQTEEQPLTDEQQHEGEVEVVSEYEARCLRAAYSDLFGQEYGLIQQVTPSPVEPSWVTR